jgi:hypothetical protein
VERDERHDPARWTRLRHRIVHLPVLVAHRRRRCAGEIEEEVARRRPQLVLSVGCNPE